MVRQEHFFSAKQPLKKHLNVDHYTNSHFSCNSHTHTQKKSSYKKALFIEQKLYHTNWEVNQE